MPNWWMWMTTRSARTCTCKVQLFNFYDQLSSSTTTKAVLQLCFTVRQVNSVRTCLFCSRNGLRMVLLAQLYNPHYSLHVICLYNENNNCIVIFHLDLIAVMTIKGLSLLFSSQFTGNVNMNMHENVNMKRDFKKTNYSGQTYFYWFPCYFITW